MFCRRKNINGRTKVSYSRILVFLKKIINN